jgi:hypothetical protein
MKLNIKIPYVSFFIAILFIAVQTIIVKGQDSQSDKTRTSLTLRSTHTNHTKPGDVITIYGQLSPEYATPPGPMPILIWVTMPDGSMYVSEPPPEGVDPTLNYIFTDDHSHYEFNIPITQYGYTRVRARWGGNLFYESSESEIIIPCLLPTGMSIVVAGNGRSSDLFDTIEILTDMAVATMRRRNVPDDPTNDLSNKIYYLHPDPNREGVDAESTPENLEWAIKNWAVDHFQTRDYQGNWQPEEVYRTPLTIFLCGSINEDPDPQNSEFVFDFSQADRVVSPVLLDEWLDELESTIVQQFVDAGISPPSYVPINVIVEGPTSGDFVLPLSKQGRVILTSTDSHIRGTDEGGKSYLSADGSVSFISMFLNRIAAGQNIQPSFAHARYEILSNQALNLQKPQLEATGNGIANEMADELATGTMPLEYRPWGDARPRLHNAFGSITLRDIPVAQFWVYVQDAEDAIASVEAVIVPPEESFEESHIVSLTPTMEPNRWEGEYDRFFGEGIYYVMYIATDEAGNFAEPITKPIIVSDSQIPEDITNLHLTCLSSNQICLRWNASISEDVQGYKIYVNPPDNQDLPDTTEYLLSDAGNVHQYFNFDLYVFQHPGLWKFRVTAYDRANLESPGITIEADLTVYIPDHNFEQALIDLGYDDELDDYVLKLNISGVTSLDVSDENIADLTGIEEFISLASLDCSGNQLTSLDVTQNTALTYLKCSNNQLTTLDVTQNTALTYLFSNHNQFRSLDVTQNTALISLRCYSNRLTSIDVTPNTALTYLYCNNNQLTSLDVTQNTALTYLACSNNPLTSIDVTQNTALTILYGNNNQLTSIDVTKNRQLETLFCSGNEITNLDLSKNIQLTALECSLNQLTGLDVRNGNNTNINSFNASNNNLTCINVDDETADHSSWNTDSGVKFSNDCSYNTQAGDQVLVPLSQDFSTTVQYETITQSGITTLETGETGPDIPGGFSFGVPHNYFDIETTASYTGAIQIVIYFGDMLYFQEDALRILHYETDHWVDVTTMIDFESRRIYGKVYSLSPFVVVEDFEPPVFENIEDVTVNNDPGEAGSIVNFTIPTATDNSSDVTVEQTDITDLTSGSFFPIGLTTLSYQAIDGAGNIASCSIKITVNNSAPIIDNITAPVDPIALGNEVTLMVTFSDDNLLEALIDWGDGSGFINGDIEDQTISWNYTYTLPGVYVVKVKLVDKGNEVVEETYRYIVIYDAFGGFVTGGGWIDSPEGAYTTDPTLTGKANFGFVSKYKKGSTVPTGNTEFQFKAGDLNFNSDDYEWLVIAGPQAKFKGDGQINGMGDYQFLVSAIDGQVNGGGDIDKFRIKIWDKATEIVEYDNQIGEDEDAPPTGYLGGGSITIHDGKGNARIADGDFSTLETLSEEQILIYPNPVRDIVSIELSGVQVENLEFHIYNIVGTRMSIENKIIYNQNIVEIDLSDISSGMYIMLIENEIGALKYKLTKL